MIRSDFIHAFSQKLATMFCGWGTRQVAMYDYYSIIARAVSRLEHNTPATRQALFERIRIILMDQLSLRQPLPSSSEVERHRMALEGAIRSFESEAAFNARPRREPARPSSIESARSDQKLVSLKPHGRSVPSGPPPQAKGAPTSVQRIIEPEKPRSETKLVWMERQKSRLQSFFELARGSLVGHLPRRRGVAASPAAVHASSTVEASHEHGAALLDESSGTIETILENGAANFATEQVAFFDRSDSEQSNKLLPMQLLDQFMIDCTDSFAPDSLKQDARTLRRWLNIENRDAIKTEHYDRFALAFQQYLSEWQGSNVHTTEQQRPSCTLTDDIRGIFSRLLEREQGAAVFEKAVSGFANLWVGLVIGLNVIGVVGLFIAEPTLRAWIAKVAEVYSPFNIGIWIVQMLAVLPGVLAFAWLWVVQDDRLRRLQASSTKVDPVFGVPWYGNALRLRRGRFRWRRLATPPSSGLLPRAPE